MLKDSLEKNSKIIFRPTQAKNCQTKPKSFGLWVFLSEEKTTKQEPLGFLTKPSKWKTKTQKNSLEKNSEINGERTKYMKNQNVEG